MKILISKSLDPLAAFNKFERLETTAANVAQFKRQYPNLKHVKVGPEFKGIMLVHNVDGDRSDARALVALLQCNMNTGYIVALEVAPEYRRHGIAEALLDLAYNMGCPMLTVRRNNLAARALYEKKGYVVDRQNDMLLYMKR